MRCLEDQMRAVREKLALSARRRPPQQKYYRLGLGIDCFDDRIGELLPAVSVMGVCLMRPDGQNSIEQQHALLSPFFQIPVIRYITA